MIMARHAYESSREYYFTKENGGTFVGPQEVEDRLDRAIERESRLGHFVISRVISDEFIAQQELFGNPVDLTRAHMKQLALPLHELIASIRRRGAVPLDVTEEVENSRTQANSLLATLIEKRDAFDIELPRYKLNDYNSLSGAISELTFFSLVLRNHEKSAYIAVPSSRVDDHADKDATGKRRASDFTVINLAAPDRTANIQIKTSTKHRGPGYVQAVPVITLEEIAGSHGAGKYKLPAALAHDGSGSADEAEIKLINQASGRLQKKLSKIEETRH